MNGGAQSLRRRLNELANSRENLGFPEDCDDIRAILAAHKEAKRELAIVKSELRGILCDCFSRSTSDRIRAGLKEKGVTL